MMEILGFTDFRVHRRFGSGNYESGLHFPKFAASYPELSHMRVERLIAGARNGPRAWPGYKYFEGTHHFHSSGGKGF
jgi:hypothetical protein